jgi:uncharacterized protein (DUF58 family)
MTDKLLDPEVMAKISGLTLQARIVVEGIITGLHRSPVRGRDVEFAEHREYSHGDELRHIDWKVYARTGRYYVKRFEQETDVRVQLLVDCSASMLVDTTGVPKLEYARRLASALAHLLLRQGDAVGLVLFDRAVRLRIGARSAPEHLAQLAEALVKTEAGPDTNVAHSLDEVAGSLPRRQMLIVISDLIDEPDRVVEAMTHLHHRGHDVIVFQVLDPQEILFDFHGGVRLRDLESGRVLEVDADRARNLYRREAERLLSRYEVELRRKGIDYSVLRTDASLADALVRYLTHRARLRARA